MLDAMETVEIKFEDGREVPAAAKPPSAFPTAEKLRKRAATRPPVIRRLMGADCTRCHGSGKEPGRNAIPTEWDEILDMLDEAGRSRAKYSSARGEGWHALEDAWNQIRDLWPTAHELGVPQGMAAQAVGVTRAQFSAAIAKGRNAS
jgi:hypothetical protein